MYDIRGKKKRGAYSKSLIRMRYVVLPQVSRANALMFPPDHCKQQMDALVSNFRPVRKKWALSRREGGSAKKDTAFSIWCTQVFSPSSLGPLHQCYTWTAAQQRREGRVKTIVWRLLDIKVPEFWQLVVWGHDRDGGNSQTWNLIFQLKSVSMDTFFENQLTQGETQCQIDLVPNAWSETFV